MPATVPENTIARYAVLYSDGTLIASAGGRPVCVLGSATTHMPSWTLSMSSGIQGRGPANRIQACFNNGYPSRPAYAQQAPQVETALIQHRDGSFAMYDSNKAGEGWRWGGGGKRPEDEREILFKSNYDGWKTTINARALDGEIYMNMEEGASELQASLQDRSRGATPASLVHTAEEALDTMPTLNSAVTVYPTEQQSAVVEVYPVVPSNTGNVRTCRLRCDPNAAPTPIEWEALHSIAHSLLDRHEVYAVYRGTHPDDGSPTCYVELHDKVKDEETGYWVGKYQNDFVSALQAELHAEKQNNPHLLTRPAPFVRLANVETAERIHFEDRLLSLIRYKQNLPSFDKDALSGYDLYPVQDPYIATYARSNIATHTLASDNIFFEGVANSDQGYQTEQDIYYGPFDQEDTQYEGTDDY